MDKNILNDYIDACALIRETEQQIRRLKAKQSETTQDSVRGSNPEFPYNSQHFKIEGTTFSMRDDARLLEKKKLLADLENPKENTDGKGDGIIQNCTKGRMHLNQSGGSRDNILQNSERKKGAGERHIMSKQGCARFSLQDRPL